MNVKLRVNECMKVIYLEVSRFSVQTSIAATLGICCRSQDH